MAGTACRHLRLLVPTGGLGFMERSCSMSMISMAARPFPMGKRPQGRHRMVLPARPFFAQNQA
jgi:hypothetical protein